MLSKKNVRNRGGVFKKVVFLNTPPLFLTFFDIKAGLFR